MAVKSPASLLCSCQVLLWTRRAYVLGRTKACGVDNPPQPFEKPQKSEIPVLGDLEALPRDSHHAIPEGCLP